MIIYTRREGPKTIKVIFRFWLLFFFLWVFFTGLALGPWWVKILLILLAGAITIENWHYLKEFHEAKKQGMIEYMNFRRTHIDCEWRIRKKIEKSGKKE